MRVKLRYTSGSSPVVLTLASTDPLSSLISQIKSNGKLEGDIEIKHSYPPKLLDLRAYPPETPIESLPFNLDGDQLTVRGLGTGAEESPAPRIPPELVKPPGAPTYHTPSSTGALTGTQAPVTQAPITPARQTKRPLQPAAPPPNKDDPPDVLIPGRGTAVLRVMEDDNSCLFRALSYLLTSGLTSPTELRQIVTTGIQTDPDTYSEAVLGQKRDEYCRWISMDSSWGGGIELSILAKWFDIEVIAIDVSTLSIMRFNEIQPRFCIVVYSGIHYDAFALSPITAFSFSSSPDQDVRIFEAGDEQILQAASELVAQLKEKKYFTDTKKFTLKCTICGAAMVGESDARGHAKRTGHLEFGEY